MRFLVVSPFLPHPSVPHAGGKFVFLALGHLSRRHEVDLVSRVFPDDRPFLGQAGAAVKRLAAVEEGPDASPHGGTLLAKARSYRRLAAEARRVALESAYDALLVEWSEAGMFLDVRGLAPAAIDCHDIVTKPFFRKWRQASGMSRLSRGALYLAVSSLERRAVRKFRVVFTRSRDDAKWAADRLGHRDVRVLPHPAGEGMRTSPRAEEDGKILFVGAMGRQVNVDAALYFYRRVFPAVRERFPRAQFWIAGGNPPPALAALAAADPALHVTGFVEDLGDHYLSASVFAAPILLGGGIIAKIPDAMACGLPVVTTPYGNEGIEARPGEEILVADTAAAFADSVCRLLADAELRRALGERGRAFAAERFARARIMETLESTLVEIAFRGRGQGL